MAPFKQEDLVRAALWYAKQGWPVFPCTTPTSDGECSCGVDGCRSSGKHGRTQHGHRDASTDKVQIIEWWRQWPDANIGIAAGPNVGTILDIDRKSGGRQSLQTMIDKYGELPDVPTVRTGGGGNHYFFRYDADNDPGNTAGTIADGIDTRSLGGLVIAPPSLHASGKRYKWIRPPKPREKLAAAPEWVSTKRRRQGATIDADGPIPEGRRNVALFTLGSAMRRQGADEATILTALLQTNSTRCQPPMDDDEVEKIASQAARYTPQPKYAEDAEYTDMGNAQRLAARHGDDLRYTEATGWHHWDGTRWARDRNGSVLRLAEDTVKAIPDERGAIDVDDAEKLKNLGKHFKNSQGEQRVSAMVKMARHHENIAEVAEVFDTDNWVLNVENGTLNLRTGELRPHDRMDMITKLAPVVYDPLASCPRFDAFLDQIMQSDRHLKTYLQRLFGYVLTGVTSEEILPIFWGGGGNGKTTILELAQAILGEDYSGPAPKDLLMQKRNETHPTELADLAGKRLVVASESGEGKRLALEVVKLLTGGDKIKGRFMRMDFFAFAATHKIILMTNDKPIIRNTGYGTWRRIRLIPFQFQVLDSEKDKYLDEKLAAEKSGVLNWMLQGCLDWQKHGLTEPREVLAATKAYQEESDILADFLREQCILDPRGVVTVDALFKTYAEWARKQGEMNPMSKSMLTRRLEPRSDVSRVTIKNVRSWRGIRFAVSDISLK